MAQGSCRIGGAVPWSCLDLSTVARPIPPGRVKEVPRKWHNADLEPPTGQMPAAGSR
jgi:hypothetical protein